MRTFIKSIIANYLSLFIITNFILSSVRIQNGFVGYTKCVLVLSVVYPLVKPLLKIVLIPLNFLTLGLANTLLGFFGIYLLHLLVSDFTVKSMEIQKIVFGNLTIQSFVLPPLFLMIVLAFLLNLFHKLIQWLLK